MIDKLIARPCHPRLDEPTSRSHQTRERGLPPRIANSVIAFETVLPHLLIRPGHKGGVSRSNVAGSAFKLLPDYAIRHVLWYISATTIIDVQSANDTCAL